MKVDENKIETSERISTLSELDAVRENDLFKTMCLPSKYEMCLIILANWSIIKIQKKKLLVLWQGFYLACQLKYFCNEFTICLFDDNYFAKVQYTSGMLVPGPLPGFGQIEGDAQNLRQG